MCIYYSKISANIRYVIGCSYSFHIVISFMMLKIYGATYNNKYLYIIDITIVTVNNV